VVKNDKFIPPFLEWVEAEDTYSLAAVKTLQEAVNTILKFLGLSPANMTEKVAEGTHTHTLLCSGNFIFFENPPFHISSASSSRNDAII